MTHDDVFVIVFALATTAAISQMILGITVIIACHEAPMGGQSTFVHSTPKTDSRKLDRSCPDATIDCEEGHTEMGRGTRYCYHSMHHDGDGESERPPNAVLCAMSKPIRFRPSRQGNPSFCRPQSGLRHSTRDPDNAGGEWLPTTSRTTNRKYQITL